jgi:hypothetical protein
MNVRIASVPFRLRDIAAGSGTGLVSASATPAATATTAPASAVAATAPAVAATTPASAVAEVHTSPYAMSRCLGVTKIAGYLGVTRTVLRIDIKRAERFPLCNVVALVWSTCAAWCEVA